MKKAFVLMTAMPPTTGHWQLIQFASLLAGETRVIINTQPHEPFVIERVSALRQAITNSSLSNIQLIHYDKTIEQDPSTLGFWPMWQRLMKSFGLRAGDYIVASEAYGQRLAEVTGAVFMPYDINRQINPAKATPVRADPAAHFSDILPEFRRHLKTTVTIFGAESTGKTTLSKQLAAALDGDCLFEYARPYLENTSNEITVDSMTAIWHGQAALQKHGKQHLLVKPITVQDTDLFSTVGYWQFPHWQEKLGACPEALVREASTLQSDLYIVTRSNIPFEPDPLRYGGTVREGSDEYWIAICNTYGLPYVVLESADAEERLATAVKAIRKVQATRDKRMAYDRHGL